MLIHNEVRKEILSLLSRNVEGVEHFFNGRAFFSNIAEQVPAIVVFLDDLNCDAVALGTTEWTGDLNIGIYLPIYEGEEKLDQIAEQIDSLIKFTGYQHIRLVTPNRQYNYEYDSEGAIWVASMLTYSICYGEKRTYDQE
ncbi:phage tail terminator protein [Caviibacterium pharyngocola]|uniref:phage tail terminator protein n=1 Tax=Caviibacterium pharyngocola TaxID=28159 RepID=UPI0013FDDDC4|nr:phage tail terminator protein [Caviibacterium pharyngocola]